MSCRQGYTVKPFRGATGAPGTAGTRSAAVLATCDRRLRRCGESRMFSQCPTDEKATRTWETTMKKEIFQENKARWEVFEWIGTTQSKIIWGAIAVIVVLGIIYLVR
jgi:hypothetical protein